MPAFRPSRLRRIVHVIDDADWRQRLLDYARLLAKYISADEFLVEGADTGRSSAHDLFRVNYTIGQKSLIVEFPENDMAVPGWTAVDDSRAILLAMATRGTTLDVIAHRDIAFMPIAEVRAGYVEG